MHNSCHLVAMNIMAQHTDIVHHYLELLEL